MLAMQSSILPEGHALSSTYESALLEIEPYLVQSVVYDVCPNDCIIFRGEYKSLSECPLCHSGRYTTGKIPARRFTYLPLKPRLIRLFGTASMAQLLQSHAMVTHSQDEKIYDVHQSRAWKNVYGNDGLFNGDSRGISLSLCTDGVNPFLLTTRFPTLCGPLCSPYSTFLERCEIVLTASC